MHIVIFFSGVGSENLGGGGNHKLFGTGVASNSTIYLPLVPINLLYMYSVWCITDNKNYKTETISLGKSSICNV